MEWRAVLENLEFAYLRISGDASDNSLRVSWQMHSNRSHQL